MLANLSDDQAALLQAGLAGHDVVAQLALNAHTSRLALLVALHGLLQTARSGVRAIMIVPTRELAQTLAEEAGQFTDNKVRCAVVVGGVGMASQETALRRGDNLVIATPKRLRNHMQRGSIRLDSLELLVVYQPGEMLGQNLLPDLQFIFNALSGKGRTLVLAKTLMAELMPLIDARCPDAQRIGPQHLRAEMPTPAAGKSPKARPRKRQRKSKKAQQNHHDSEPTRQIQDGETPTDQKHRVFEVAGHLKTRLLCQLLKHEQLDEVIVFVDGRHRAERVVHRLRDTEITAKAIHSGLSRTQRTNALKGFEKGRYTVLVVTARAVRWVKLPPVQHIVNYELPRRPGDYRRQIRRVTKGGVIINLVAPKEANSLKKIDQALQASIGREVVPGFDYDEPPALGDKSSGNENANLEEFESGSEIPRTWGSRTAIRTNEAQKVLLADYEPLPLPEIWQVTGKYSDVTQKERIPPHKYPPPEAEGTKSGSKSKRSGRRRRRKKGDGKNRQRRSK